MIFSEFSELNKFLNSFIIGFISLMLLIFNLRCTDVKPIEEINFDTLRISVNEQYLSEYNSIGILNREESNVLVGYNYTKHSLDYFDLSSKGVIKSVLLDSYGPNKIEPLGKIATNGSLIASINPVSGVLILDYSCKLVENLSLNFFENEFLKLNINKSLYPIGISFGNYDDYFFNENMLLFPLYSDIKKTELNYENPLNYALYNLGNKNLKILNLDYPEYFRNDFYGDLDQSYALLKGDSIIYCFANSANIYVHDLKSNNKSTIVVNSILGKEQSGISLFDYNDSHKRLDYFLNSSRYHSLKYDSTNNLFFRVFRDKPEKNRSLSAQNYLLVLDEKLKLIKEVKLNFGPMPDIVVVDNKLMYQYQQNESALCFLFIELMNLKK